MAESALPPQFIDDELIDDESLEQRAQERRRRFTSTIDMYLVLTVGVLIAIGLMMVWSTTFFWSEPQQSSLFFQQARNAFLGVGLMFGISLINYRLWRRFATPLMVAVVIALFLVLFLNPVFGARRSFFEGSVQPSEAAGTIVILYMAAWLSSKQGKLGNITYGLLPFAILVAVVGGLLIAEPDLSTATLILFTAFAMFFLAGVSWTQILITLAVFIVAGVIAISNINYARLRVQNFVELLRDPIQAKADQAQNVIISFLNGGITGVGLGESRQKFELLSAPHTDSIFAVIGEELGLIGCALVIALFVVLLIRGFRIGRDAPDMFGALLAAGITISIVLKALFNIAVMAAVVPFAGVPLPFISFGGSSLVSMLAGIGIVLSVSRATARKSTAPTRRVNETLILPGVRGTMTRVRQHE